MGSSRPPQYFRFAARQLGFIPADLRRKNMTNEKIGILTSGGDSPGMNAAIRAATLVGIAHGREVIGIERGYAGLIEGAFVPLTAQCVDPIVRQGGTMLGTARSKAFMTPEGREEARRQLARAGIGQVMVIGGNAPPAQGRLQREGARRLPFRLLAYRRPSTRYRPYPTLHRRDVVAWYDRRAATVS